MPTYTITTLGCKVNQFESEAIEHHLNASGWSPTKDEQPADLCIINTCTVTRKASMQSRQAIRQAIRHSPGALIVVTGCYAQTEPEESQKIKGVHWIIGQTDKHRLPEMILSSHLKDYPSHPVVIRADVRDEHTFRDLPGTICRNRTRPFLKIQDGCSAFCAYCVVPFARGPSRSLPFESVLEKIKSLRNAGYHEVVLSGIHLGAYGLDLTPKRNLLSLLEVLDVSRAMNRIRLSSIEPKELTEDIINLVAESDILCHHFHIPLQSGDDDILKQMRRPYSRAFFKDLVHKIRDRIPDASIGVDILIGFPGETETAFKHTYELIEELPVTYLHVFPFSPRRGTEAFLLNHQVPQHEIKERAQKMRGLSNLKKSMFYIKFIHDKVEVLLERKIESNKGMLKGTSANYLPVVVSAKDDFANTLVFAEIKGFHTEYELLGVI